MSSERRAAALIPVLIFTTTVVSLISSLGAPLLPSIARSMHVSLSDAQWALTATVLVGAVTAPIMGRLGDGPRRRETMIAGLAVVCLGGVVAALAPSLGLLVAGRALQGVGLGLVPLTMAAARDHLPREQGLAAIGVLSIATAAGVGVGYPLSGLLATVLGLSAAFWFGVGVTGLALLCAIAVIPSSAARIAPPVDLAGATLLGSGLTALLLAVAEGKSWGWSSATVLGLFAIASATLGWWVYQQLHSPAPLVELRLLRHPAVLTANGCAIVLGVAMYMLITAVTEFVQAPRALTGYGFSASVVVAGLCLVPLSATSLLWSRSLSRITERFGTRALLAGGCLAVAAAAAFLAAFHNALWEAFVMMAILGVGIASTSGAIPGLIVRAVPAGETGSAMGFYQVVRFIGFSVGSALAASILAIHTQAGRQLPTADGYTAVLWVAAAICVAAAALAWFLPARAAATRHLGEVPNEAQADPQAPASSRLTRA